MGSERSECFGSTTIFKRCNLIYVDFLACGTIYEPSLSPITFLSISDRVEYESKLFCAEYELFSVFKLFSLNQIANISMRFLLKILEFIRAFKTN